MKKSLLLFILSSIYFQIIKAADITWNGGGDGTTWESGANWVGGVAPINSDNAIFDGTTGVTITSGGTINIVNLTFTNSASITFTPAVTTTGSISLTNASTAIFNGILTAEGINVSGTGTGNMTIAGANSIEKDQTVISAPFTLTVNASFQYRRIIANADFIINGSGTVTTQTKNGVIASNSTHTYNGTGTYTINTVGLDINSGSSIVNNGNMSVASGSSIVNNGNMSAASGSSITVNGTITNNGTLGGAGTVVQSGTFTNNVGSKIQPGDSGVGTLNITGDFDLGSADLECEINGDASFDVLAVTGTATIGGSSELSLSFNYTPNVNQTYNIITGGTAVSGNFSGGNISTSGGGVQTVVVTNQTTFTRVEATSVLPIELIYFKALLLDNENVELLWQTASEINNQGFEIEHSIDKRTWKVISFVVGEGTTFDKQSYSFLHENPTTGINYYRLKQMDYDGAFEYSNIVSIQLAVDSRQLAVRPNPVQNGEVTLTLPDSDFESGQIELFSSTGQRVLIQQISNSNTKLDVRTLPKGIYWLNALIDGKRTSEKIIIQ